MEIIIKSLKKEPAGLSPLVWKPLRRHGLLRTVDEQRVHLLLDAPPSALNDTIYSTGMKRALKAALALDSKTQNLELCFKSGDNAELDLLLKDNRLLINDKWMVFHRSHECDPSFCPLRNQASGSKIQVDIFTCGHIVETLYASILNELPMGLNKDPIAPLKNNHDLRLKVSEKIVQTPLRVELECDIAGEIQVSWVDPERHSTWEVHKVTCQGWVTLYRVSTCVDKQEDLLAICKLMVQYFKNIP